MTPPLLNAALDAATSGLDLEMQEPAGPDASVAERRRSRQRPRSRLASMTLAEVDGVLRIQTARASHGLEGRRRRRGPAPALGGEVVREFRFEELPPSEIGRYLGTLDAKLNGASGLRQLRRTDKGADLGSADATGEGRTLLFVHGSFSKSEAFIEPLRGTEHGQAFLDAVTTLPEHGGRYARVLTFDHATLGVSPVMNAFDLAHATRELTGPIDVIAHSRGGLVARWWMTGFRPDFGDGRTVFVGAPLAGTSLAAAPRLKESMELLANMGNAFLGVSTLAPVALPFLSVATGLMKVLTSVTTLTARSPLLDAVLALIPGLASQGRVGNNPELARLQRLVGEAPPHWYAVRANFEPEPTGWKFWKRFTRLGSELADAGSDLVFREANDLVVDGRSMTTLSDSSEIPAERTLDFGTSGLVHHCNYFEQPSTVRFLRDVFQLP